jgi:hypothetical protein
VGRHTAADGASRHPLVAAALAQRATATGQRDGGGSPGRESGLGWPGPPPAPGRGLGWPGDAATDAGGAGTDEAAAAEEPAPASARRGWRRLFRLDPAA